MGYGSIEFKSILNKIKKGEAVDDSLLLPFLTLESREVRWQVNLQLAAAYYQQHEQQREGQSLRRAGSCIERALLLSRYSAEVLPLYIEINRALQDVAAIKEAFKRVGVEHAAQGNFGEALALFDRWAYAHAEFSGIDIHTYDPDIIASVERMSALHRFEARDRVRRRQGGRIRLAYLMHGLTQVNSVLVKIDQVFARLHDKARFEIAYFTTEDESTIVASPDAQSAIENIRRNDCKMVVPRRGENLYEHLISVGNLIYDFEPDILITSAGLGTFQSYFITCLKPAPVVISFNQGPSPQFSWHTFDHSISWFQTNISDCPADCSYVPLEFDWPANEGVPATPRSSQDIPAAATVIVSGGRWPKFQEPHFWRAMIELLRERADLYWIVIGVVADQVPFLSSLLTPEVQLRIRFLGWRTDYLELIAAADLVVDSYPVGGGVFLMEAMSLGIPVISFTHDYISAFSNNDCSGGDEIVGIPELLITRGDFEQLTNLISKLAVDREYRLHLGTRCFEWIHQTRGEPARMVRRCEEIYERVLRVACEASEASDAQGVTGRWEDLSGDDVPDKELDERKLLLIEQASILSRREAALNRREAQYSARFLFRLRRGLQRRWQKLFG